MGKIEKAILTGVGLIVFFSDIKDVPKIDRFHHWQLGALLIVAGLDA